MTVRPLLDEVHGGQQLGLLNLALVKTKLLLPVTDSV